MPGLDPHSPGRAPDAAGAAPAMRRECALVPLADEGPGTPVPVQPLPFFIGRHDECQLVLPGENIMRKHAKIRLQDGDFFLTDLATYHGTYVNGQSVVESAIRDGDIVRIGGHKLRVQILEIAAPEPAASAAGPSVRFGRSLVQGLRQVGAGAWIALVLALAALAGGIVVHQRRQEQERIRTQVIDLEPVALVEGTSRIVAVAGIAEAVVDRPAVAAVEVVPEGVAVEAINPGDAEVVCTVPEQGTRRFTVTVARAPSPLDRWPELRGVLALGLHERSQKAQGYADEAARLYAAREEILGNRWKAAHLYGLAQAVLDTLPQKTTLLDTVRTRRAEIERELDGLWETTYSQLKQAHGVGDVIRARDQAHLLSKLFPEESGQRHSIARVYLDRLR